jgi:chromosomal replication initiation ATPase DnaA
MHVPLTNAPPAQTIAAPVHIRSIVELSVSRVFGISPDHLGSVTRGRARVALARQIAMYLSHVAFRVSLTDVGRIFGRDRTTVSHACAVVEDLRDDPRFDRILDLLERIVRFQAAAQGTDALPGGEVLR